MTEFDFRITEEPSMVRFDCLTTAGQAWADANLVLLADNVRVGGFAIRAKFVPEIIRHIQVDGLTIWRRLQ